MYSALIRAGAEYVRQDFATEAWHGPPEQTVAWWQAEIPRRNAAKAKLAPDEVLWQLFMDLAERPDEADKRYVLALFLIRRRMLKVDETAEGAGNVLRVFHTRSGEEYETAIVDFDEDRAAEIQRELMSLLYAETEPANDDATIDDAPQDAPRADA